MSNVTYYSCYFNPRPPRGGRLFSVWIWYNKTIISIHALRGEGDVLVWIEQEQEQISIHALRGEGDAKPIKLFKLLLYISIHALRGEGD